MKLKAMTASSNMEQLINIPDGGSLSRVIYCTPVPTVEESGSGPISPDSGTCPTDTLKGCPGTTDALQSGAANITLGRDARLNLVFLILPGTPADINLTVDLNGEGSEVLITGLYLCPSQEKVNINVDLHHNVPACTSRQLFKGIVGGSAEASFYGKITVAQDAFKTEAYQENHNLLLSETAIANTKPQLEIYADDVKCSHGATIGRLSEEEQFYMRSRGIPEAEAKVLQMVSFLSPVLDGIEDESARSTAADQVAASLRSFA